MHPNEIAAAVSVLKESGKILDFGVSNFSPSQLSLLNNKNRCFCKSNRIFPYRTFGNAQWSFRSTTTKRDTTNVFGVHWEVFSKKQIKQTLRLKKYWIRSLKNTM